MKEDSIAWIKIMLMFVLPVRWLFLVLIKILCWFNCVVVHRSYWEEIESTHWEEECGPYGIGLCFGIREWFRCSKCCRKHRGKRYQSSDLPNSWGVGSRN